MKNICIKQGYRNPLLSRRNTSIIRVLRFTVVKTVLTSPKSSKINWVVSTPPHLWSGSIRPTAPLLSWFVSAELVLHTAGFSSSSRQPSTVGCSSLHRLLIVDFFFFTLIVNHKYYIYFTFTLFLGSSRELSMSSLILRAC
jgi:hypothetical protein